jgi:hypothetical protein
MGNLEPASKRAKTNSTHFSQTSIFQNLLSASLNCFMFLLQLFLTDLLFLSFSKALEKRNPEMSRRNNYGRSWSTKNRSTKY